MYREPCKTSWVIESLLTTKWLETPVWGSVGCKRPVIYCTRRATTHLWIWTRVDCRLRPPSAEREPSNYFEALWTLTIVTMIKYYLIYIFSLFISLLFSWKWSYIIDHKKLSWPQMVSYILKSTCIIKVKGKILKYITPILFLPSCLMGVLCPLDVVLKYS